MGILPERELNGFSDSIALFVDTINLSTLNCPQSDTPPPAPHLPHQIASYVL